MYTNTDNESVRFSGRKKKKQIRDENESTNEFHRERIFHQTRLIKFDKGEMRDIFEIAKRT